MSERSLAVIVTKKLSRAVAVLLLAGLAAATLIQLAPGFGSTEQELDPRLSRESISAIRERYVTRGNALGFYRDFLGRLLHGDAGYSTLFERPVADLIAERAGTTAWTVSIALCLSWAASILAASGIALTAARLTAAASITVSGVLLSVPSAVLATVCLVLSAPPAFAIAAVVFPRVFPYVYEQLHSVLGRPHVVMARARGVSRHRVMLFHVCPTAALPILALLGISVTLAIGAAIPVEVLADSPGIGQLAWRAALARDLPVLVAVTLFMTAVTVSANLLFDIVIERLGGARS